MKNKALRVGLFSYSQVPEDGAGRLTFEYCAELAQRGDVEFYLYLPRNAGRIETSFARSVRYDLPEVTFRMRNPVRLLEYLTWMVEDPGLDVVHSLLDYPTAFLATRFAKKYGKPIIVNLIGTYAIAPLFWIPDKWMLQYVFRSADRLLAISHFTGTEVSRVAASGLPITVIPLGTKSSRFSNGANEAHCVRDQFHPGTKLVLTVGGLKPRKGQDISLRAFHRVSQVLPQCKYIMIGRGSWKSYLYKLARDLGVADDIIILSDVGDDAILAFYHACDVYLQTSRQVDWFFEGYGLTYLEAAACGKPSVGSRSGGVPDAVIDGYTGILVPEEDVESTAEALLRILTNNDLAKRLGDQAKAFANQQSWGRYVTEVMRIYREVVS